MQGELNWFLVSDSRNVDEDAYIMKMKHIDDNVEQKEKQISTLTKEMTEATVGPCVSSLDGILKSMGVERQAYHSNSFIGNDCHLLLKSENVTKLCYSILDIVRELEKDNELLIEVGISCEQFEILFNKYGCCHIVFNSARHLDDDDDIDLLSADIKSFMDY